MTAQHLFEIFLRELFCFQQNKEMRDSLPAVICHMIPLFVLLRQPNLAALMPRPSASRSLVLVWNSALTVDFLLSVKLLSTSLSDLFPTGS